MDYRHLGNSGLQVSVVGLGTNNFGGRTDAAQTEAIVNTALDLGVNFFDTADQYGNMGRSEEFLGLALKGKRRDVVIGTKWGQPMREGPHWSGASRRYIYDAVHDSLRRLGTDYIDLYQLHTPDPATPIEETLRALDDLVRSGEIRYIGFTKFSAAQFTEAALVARYEHLTPFISAQYQYSLLDRGIEREIAGLCGRFGLGILPFFPLASGMLTGKYRRGQPAPEGTRLSGGPFAARTLTDANFDIVEKLEAIAEGAGHTILDLAMSWLAQQPRVSSVIAGATKPEQVTQNVEATNWRLSADVLAAVDEVTKKR